MVKEQTTQPVITIKSENDSVEVEKRIVKMFSSLHPHLREKEIRISVSIKAFSVCVQICAVRFSVTEKGLLMLDSNLKQFMTSGTYKKYNSMIKKILSELSSAEYADVCSVAQNYECAFVVNVCAYWMSEMMDKDPKLIFGE